MIASPIIMPVTSSPILLRPTCTVCGERGRCYVFPHSGRRACFDQRQRDSAEEQHLDPDNRMYWIHPPIESAPDALPAQVSNTNATNGMDALRAELAATRAENEALRTERADLYRRLDRFETTGAVETLDRQAAEITQLHAEKRQLIELITDRTLKPAERVAGAAVMEKAGAYRLRLALGVDAQPVAWVRVRAGEVEAEIGIARGTFARHIKPVIARGHLQYRIVPDPEGTEKGRPRSIGLVAPGDGQLHAMEDLRRKRDREKKQADRDERTRKEERDRERIAELEAALEKAKEGCPLCGDRLLPADYHCFGCATNHAAVDLVGMRFPDDSSRKSPQSRDEEFPEDSSRKCSPASIGEISRQNVDDLIYKIIDDSSEKSPPTTEQERLDELLDEIQAAARVAYNRGDTDELGRRRAQASALRKAIAARERVAYAS